MKPLTLILLLTSLSLAATAADYRYDNLGRLTTAIHPSGETLNYQYDNMGNLLNINKTTTSLHTLSGHITDRNNQALANVLIRIGDYQTNSNTQGNYQLPNLPAATYHLNISHPDHQFNPQSIQLDANHTGIIDITAL